MKTLELDDLGLIDLNMNEAKDIDGGFCTSDYFGGCVCGTIAAIFNGLEAGFKAGAGAWDKFLP